MNHVLRGTVLHHDLLTLSLENLVPIEFDLLLQTIVNHALDEDRIALV